MNAVAINWHRRFILLGECKWGTDQVGQDVIRETLERKTPLVLRALPAAGERWTAHYAFFARAGFTEAARSLAQTHGALLVALDRLGQELGKAQTGE